MNESRYLWKFQPSERYRHHGCGGILFSNAFSKSVELGDVTPAAPELHPNMPAGGQLTAKTRTGKKIIDRGMALPRGEHRQMAELHP